ncbi:MAG: hypothetical protein AAF628_24560 [Planctomycetota bacterium]
MLDLDKELAVTRHVLDAASLRSRAIMHNIANQNTPGYKRFTVSFEQQLRQAHADGLPLGQVRPVVERDLSGAPEANNVSVMQELAQLEKVQLIHDLFSRRAGGYFTHLNKAIFGRGG